MRGAARDPELTGAGAGPAAAESALGEPELVLVRYGELSLKAGNRRMFERALARNIVAATRAITPVTVERSVGRLTVRAPERVQRVAERLQDVFGIKSVSPGWGVENEPEAIAALARRVLARALAGRDERGLTFRVRVKRAEKRFPVRSADFERWLADRVLPDHPGLVVKLSDPEVVLGVDVREGRTYVFSERLPGPGGLPVGTLGRALCLLSGGIDSPVAAWMTMKRGCLVSYVSFWSYPYIGEASRRKVADLARALARYQSKSRLYVVPFTEIQTAIRDTAPEGYRTVLYRRMMQRIASRIALRDHFSILVTGESLGQVASQTLENMTCIGAAADVPVMRPLVGFDKEETIAIARRIGTLETSSRPEPDCCTVFLPRKPVIYGKPAECEAAERELDVEALVERALAATEIETIDDED